MSGQAFEVAALVNAAQQVLGVSSYVAAGALHGREGTTLTIGEAQSIVAEFLGKQVNDPLQLIAGDEVVVVSTNGASIGQVIALGDGHFELVNGGSGGGGSSELPVATKTSAYSVQPTDRVLLLDATSAAFAVELPPAAGWHQRLELVAITVGEAIVTANPHSGSGATIDRKSAVSLGSPASGAEWQSISLVSDQTNWWSV